jgi:hypothetical protein
LRFRIYGRVQKSLQHEWRAEKLPYSCILSVFGIRQDTSAS